MTSETLVECAPILTTKIRKAFGPQVKRSHNRGEDHAFASRTTLSKEQAKDVDGEKTDNLTISFERQSEQHASPQLPRRTTILPASSVTVDFDELRFEAASARQLRILTPEGQHPLPPTPEQESELLISSPYNHPEHLLNLTSLDTQSRLLALALAVLKPIRPDYATADYLDSFNWPEVLRILRMLARDEGAEWRESKFYTVIFRSKLNAEIDGEKLGELDKHSHREATESGGLLKYWFGKAGVVGRENLATCIWRSREDAVRGGAGPWHAEAMRAKMEMYERIGFKRYFLVVGDGALDVRMEEL